MCSLHKKRCHNQPKALAKCLHFTIITPKREKQITKTQTQNKQASNFLPSTKRKK
jgi:hypothetical protein